MKQYMIYYEVIVYDIINESPTSKERNSSPLEGAIVGEKWLKT